MIIHIEVAQPGNEIRADTSSGCSVSKYFELQEVWEQVGATSVLSIPIPAVRYYESASIVEAPAPVEETSSDPASNASHVLHNTNGAIGVVTVGLATENIDLNGRYAPQNAHSLRQGQCHRLQNCHLCFVLWLQKCAGAWPIMHPPFNMLGLALVAFNV